MTTHRKKSKLALALDGLALDGFENDFEPNMKLDKEDFALWLSLGWKPEELVNPETRKRYKAYLAKQQQKKKR